MLKQVQHDVWNAKSQEPTANSQRPKAKKLYTAFGRWRWVTAAKALGGVDESFGDVPQKLLSEEDIV